MKLKCWLDGETDLFLVKSAKQPDFENFDGADWLSWFHEQDNLRSRERLIYDERPLSDGEVKLLRRSIAQFQLGEMSDGACLIGSMTHYALRSGQDDLVTCAHLLVRRARHHAFLLAEFMQHQNLRQVRFHPLDTCFRIIRRLGGIETMLSTLMIAELIATHYYQCLGHSTRSMMLKRISMQLLADEEAHIQFYRKLLWDLRKGRSPLRNKLAQGIERLVFVCALCAVWPFHNKVYRRAGTGFSAYWHIYRKRFQAVSSKPRSGETAGSIAA